MADQEKNRKEAGKSLKPARKIGGTRLFRQSCTFLGSYTDTLSLPRPDLLEVAFCGRSNVGKSSLLNALTGRADLARVSKTPGRTRALNFFDLGKSLRLVDLPGYGYAAAPRKELVTWRTLIDGYLRKRPNLRRVLLLVDARHPLKDNDRLAMTVLDEAGISYQVVLTKIDKQPAAERPRLIAEIDAEISRHPAAHPRVLATSARAGLGMDQLRAEIAALAQA
jgi:GTP-binding protein